MEKLYYIKLGNLYIANVFLDKNAIKNTFIQEICFDERKDNVYFKISGSERDNFTKVIDNVLFGGLDEASRFIEFEEVEEEHE